VFCPEVLPDKSTISVRIKIAGTPSYFDFQLQWQGIWVIKPNLENYQKKISVGDYERKSRKRVVKGVCNGGSKDIYRG
jgi:hypothetical protein